MAPRVFGYRAKPLIEPMQVFINRLRNYLKMAQTSLIVIPAKAGV
jgi:hypothetical protein